MTVSPPWPQDGNRPPSAAPGGVDSDDSFRSPALPPTLFQLPNLTPASQQEQPVPSPKQDQGEAPTPAPQPAVAQKSSVPAPPPSPPEPSPSADASDVDHPTPPTPPPVSAVSTPTRRAPTSDRPAGRSWMETVGSHGVVVVLLLVVVAAALITGRKSRQQSSDSTLSEHSNLLHFDQDTPIDLPIPVHGSAADTELAVSADADRSNQNQAPTVTTLESSSLTADMVAANASAAPTGTAQAPSDQMDGSPTGASIPPQFEFGQNSAAPAEAASESLATLDTDLANPAASETAGPDADGRVQANRVQVNQFVSGNPNVDMHVASNRIPTENVDTLPSLEDLADQPATGAAEPDNAQPPMTKPRVSSMPAGMKNLLQYLPDLKDPAVVPDQKPNVEAADAGIPTTSE